MSGSDAAMMAAAPQNWSASSDPIGSGLTAVSYTHLTLPTT